MTDNRLNALLLLFCHRDIFCYSINLDKGTDIMQVVLFCETGPHQEL